MWVTQKNDVRVPLAHRIDIAATNQCYAFDTLGERWYGRWYDKEIPDLQNERFWHS